MTITCNYLFMCSGYYSYSEPYDAKIPGLEQFAGRVVQPQFWPDDLDDAGKRVVVIGSGATAMTLVPAMAATAGHVTMLQRSPTYVVSRPDEDVVANGLRRVLPDKLAYRITRRKNVMLQQFFYDNCQKKPAKWKSKLVGLTRKELPDVDVDTHFTPRYNPWDQRLCLIPNGDLYEAIRSGNVDVVTDTIDTVTPTGIRLTSGDELDADIIVTATGLQLVTLGEVGLRRRRAAGRLLPDMDVQGLRLLRRAQPGVVVRVHQRLVDAARRPDVRVRLPPAQPHGRHRHAPVRAAPASERRRHAGAAVDRGVLVGLRAARAAPAAQAG